jgi:hypothetical protein
MAKRIGFINEKDSCGHPDVHTDAAGILKSISSIRNS